MKGRQENRCTDEAMSNMLKAYYGNDEEKNKYSTFTVVVECHQCQSKHYIYPSGPGYQEYKCGCGKVVRVTS